MLRRGKNNEKMKKNGRRGEELMDSEEGRVSYEDRVGRETCLESEGREGGV